MVLKRYITDHLRLHLANHRQMAFLSGPRQVGKTTVSHSVIAAEPKSKYLNWDNVEDRQRALLSPSSLCDTLYLDDIEAAIKVCAIDEFHKQAIWRNFLKSIYDTYPALNMLITGSGMLQKFGRGGDSLIGRFFPYTLHPLSVAELVRNEPESNQLIHDTPREIPHDQWEALIKFGGFPEPFLTANTSFHNQWQGSWHDQLLREEVRDLTRVQELSQIETLAVLLQNQTGSLTSYSSFARQMGCSVDSIRRWLEILQSLFFCFKITPWFKNLNRALRKGPKFYMWDWSLLGDLRARCENLVASSLFKATQFWTETGQGQFSLHFVRDKEKREVDFLVAKEGEPWILIRVESSSLAELSPHLLYFKKKLNVPHALQLAFDADFREVDCVFVDRPMVVPAKSFLSQLV